MMHHPSSGNNQRKSDHFSMVAARLLQSKVLIKSENRHIDGSLLGRNCPRVPPTLSLLNVSIYFRARATNTQIGQEENSGYTFLEVYGEDGADVPPEIVVPPRDKTVVRGTTLSELHCVANARPLHALEILWFKDGRPIDQVGVPFSFNDLWNRTLSLFEADFKHQGAYLPF